MLVHEIFLPFSGGVGVCAGFGSFNAGRLETRRAIREKLNPEVN
jgi:hypothetical protein